MTRRVNVRIYGRVQGVFFRRETQKNAVKFHLQGFVRNRYDGSVEAEFEGSEESIEKMIQWCHIGSSYARVDEVIVKNMEPINSKDYFKVLPTE